MTAILHGWQRNSLLTSLLLYMKLYQQSVDYTLLQVSYCCTGHAQNHHRLTNLTGSHLVCRRESCWAIVTICNSQPLSMIKKDTLSLT